jgi:hypothetical protein
MNPADKPTRVVDQTYSLGRCPVCDAEMTGTLTVEVHLGEVAIQPWDADDGTRREVEATATVSTSLRSLDVRHRCNTTWRSRTAVTE